MLILACCLIGLATLTLAFRYLYMRMLIRWWEEVVVYYVVSSGAHPSKGDQYAQTWPMYLIMAYAWEWDVARFIVDQEGAGLILAHFEQASQDSP